MEAARIFAVIGANTGGFVRGMSLAGGAVDSFAARTRSRLAAVGGFVTKWAKRGGLAVAAFAAFGLKAAIDFKDSFAGVRKTVDASEKQFARLEQGFRNMAKTMPIGVNELNRVGEAAGQLGIKVKNILGFTDVMAKLGVATNLSSDQAATALARLANITRMPQTKFDRLGSTVVDLGNNLATTEAEIVEMGLRIAGAGKQVGLTEAEILGFAGALSSVGIEAQAGGTSISRAFITVASAIEEGGGKLETFARVAGTSADDFKRSFERDAAGAMITFIEGLGKMSDQGKDVFGVLDKLGLGNLRVRDALLRASGAGDLFRKSLKLGSKAWEENNALNEEAARKFATVKSRLIVAKNRVIDLAIQLGQNLAPGFASVIEKAAGAAEKVGAFIEKVANAPDFTTKMKVVFTGVKNAVAGLVDRIRDALFGTGGFKPLKLKSGKIVELVDERHPAFVDRFQDAIRSGFERVDWGRVGRAIIDGITAGLKAGGRLAGALTGIISDAIGFALFQIDWAKLGAKMGPGLITAFFTAITALFNPVFWIKNWKVVFGVAFTALTIAFAPARLVKAIPFVGAFLMALRPVLRVVFKFLGRLGLAFLRGLLSRVAPRAAIGAARVVGRILDTLKVLPKLVGPFFIQMARVAGEKLGGMLVTVGKLVARIVRAIIGKTGLGSLARKVAEKFGDVKARIAGLTRTFFTTALFIGKAIVNGIMSALRSLPGLLKDAIVGAAKSALDGIKSFLGAASPSKLFAVEVGAPIAEGIAAGITSKTAAIERALQRAVTPPAPPGAGARSTAAATSPGGRDGAAVNVEHLHVESAVDIELIAAALSRKLATQ